MKLNDFSFYQNVLHFACESGSFDLVKYLISLNEIDIKLKNVSIYFFLLIMFVAINVFI